MTQPYLSFNELRKPQDNRGVIWGNAIRQIGSDISGVIEKEGKKKESLYKGVNESYNKLSELNRKFTTDKVVDKASKIKQDIINITDKGFFLNGKKKAEIMQKMSELDSYIAVASQGSQMLDDANNFLKKSGNFDKFMINKEQLDDYTEALESGDMVKIRTAVDSLDEGDSPIPFTEVRPSNASLTLSNLYQDTWKKFGESVDSVVTKPYKEGEKTISTKNRVIGEEKLPEVKEFLYNNLISNASHPKGIKKELTDQEWIEAQTMYPQDPFKAVRYYVDNKIDYATEFAPKRIGVKRDVDLVPSKKSKTDEIVKKVDGVWNFGTSSVGLIGTYDFYENGKKTTASLDRAKIYKVIEDISPDGAKNGAYAVALIPKKEASLIEQFAELTLAQKEGREPRIDKSKVREVYIPLKDIKAPLESKLNKMGMSLEGFGEVNLDLKEDSIDWNEYKRK